MDQRDDFRSLNKQKYPHFRTLSERINGADLKDEHYRSVLTRYRPPHPNPKENWWTTCSRIATCCCLPAFLTRLNILGYNVQQAWREKITLCLFILGISSFVAYFTTGLRGSICLEQDAGIPYFEPGTRAASWRDDVIINGFTYDFNMLKEILARNSPMIPITEDWHGQNLSPLFSAEPNLCQKFLNNEVPFCSINNQFINSPGLEAVPCLSHEIIHTLKQKGRLSFSYKDVNESVQAPHLLVIYNNAVVNLTSFLTGIEISKFKNLGDISWIVPGNDMTLRANLDYRDIDLMKCLSSRYAVGYVGIESAGCAFYSILMILAILIVMAVILARFIMALIFHWAIAPHISTARSVKVGRYDNAQGRTITFGPSNNPSTGTSQDWARSLALPSDLYTICLVTCYSEDEVSIRKTLDSIAATDHPDERKLLFVICDGLIQGEGNEFSTPDIVMSLFEKDPLIKSTEPMSYLAIADGEKQTNMARVCAGKYLYQNRRVPIIVVIKCGTEKERTAPNPEELKKKKPGNRGKRDSQLILINFLSRVTFNDRMTELDYDLFWKIQHITGGITSDQYELLLMVDADTVLQPDSLRYMVQTMVNDEKIMGLCGETRIANKLESWVTMIQVYEYFTNHNLGKSFESVFGVVTCLPGCFCMYRVKSIQNQMCVPLIVNPEIVEAYSENVLDTLHKKNLLLLGEDRFLSTLMLKTFPKRKMVFVPKAICHTTVPHTYKMLQSQRRRWINSTIHNLLELVLVPTLCGTFCFSLQFIIAIDLFGTISLPIAVVLMISMIVASLQSHLGSTLPLILFVIALFLPGILVLLTTKKPIYILWMLVYLLSIPIWNFALPLYAFWHFDDFSWGDSTRKVEGEIKGHDHSKRQGKYEIGSVKLKKWEEWEILRQRNIKDYLFDTPYEVQTAGKNLTRTIIAEANNPENPSQFKEMENQSRRFNFATAPVHHNNDNLRNMNYNIDTSSNKRRPQSLTQIEQQKLLMNSATEIDKDKSLNPLEQFVTFPRATGRTQHDAIDSNAAPLIKKELPPSTVGLLSQNDSTIFHDAFSRTWGVDLQNPEMIRSSMERPRTAFKMAPPEPSIVIEKPFRKSKVRQTERLEKQDIKEKKDSTRKRISKIGKRYSMPLVGKSDFIDGESQVIDFLHDLTPASTSVSAHPFDHKLEFSKKDQRSKYEQKSVSNLSSITEENSSFSKAGNTINKFWKSLYLQQSQIHSKIVDPITDSLNNGSKIYQDSFRKTPNPAKVISPQQKSKQIVSKKLFTKSILSSNSNDSTPEPISINIFPRSLKNQKDVSVSNSSAKREWKTTSLDLKENSILITADDPTNLSFQTSSTSSSEESATNQVSVQFEMGPDETVIDASLDDISNSNRSSIHGPRPCPNEWTELNSIDIKSKVKTSTTTKQFLQILNPKTTLHHQKVNDQGLTKPTILNESFDDSMDEEQNNTVGKKFQQVWKELSVFKDDKNEMKSFSFQYGSSGIVGPRPLKR